MRDRRPLPDGPPEGHPMAPRPSTTPEPDSLTVHDHYVLAVLTTVLQSNDLREEARARYKHLALAKGEDTAAFVFDIADVFMNARARRRG